MCRFLVLDRRSKRTHKMAVYSCIPAWCSGWVEISATHLSTVIFCRTAGDRTSISDHFIVSAVFFTALCVLVWKEPHHDRRPFQSIWRAFIWFLRLESRGLCRSIQL